MKVYIGKYKSWFGPYQLAEKILFWKDKDKDDIVHKFGEWLAGESKQSDEELEKMFNRDEKKSLLYRFLLWIDSKKKRTVKIKIHNYDTWNMNNTLALIILPMLKQLKETKHGSFMVDVEDVPENLRPTEEANENNGYTDNTVHERCEWVLNEMIWAFEQLQPDCDWEDQYRSGVSDLRWQKTDQTFDNPLTGKTEFTYLMVRGPNDTYQLDMEGMEQHQKRIDRGMLLFGKYFQGLWD